MAVSASTFFESSLRHQAASTSSVRLHKLVLLGTPNSLNEFLGELWRVRISPIGVCDLLAIFPLGSPYKKLPRRQPLLQMLYFPHRWSQPRYEF